MKLGHEGQKELRFAGLLDLRRSFLRKNGREKVEEGESGGGGEWRRERIGKEVETGSI